MEWKKHKTNQINSIADEKEIKEPKKKVTRYQRFLICIVGYWLKFVAAASIHIAHFQMDKLNVSAS